MKPIKYFVTENKQHTKTFFGAILVDTYVCFTYDNKDVEELVIPNVVQVLQEKVIKQLILSFVIDKNDERYYHAACVIATKLAKSEVVQWTALDDVKDMAHFRKELKGRCETE